LGFLGADKFKTKFLTFQNYLMVFSAVILTVMLAMEAKGNYQVIKVKTPLSELDRYCTSLLSITQ
tara:strand:+ start:9471 stop:9665 length:195 start_codon:yes stop_codon:yes gene_type:complete